MANKLNQYKDKILNYLMEVLGLKSNEKTEIDDALDEDSE
jgi:hypothetical protein